MSDMTNLIIMRHGDALWNKSNDRDRTLSEKGKVEVEKTAKNIKSYGMNIDHLLVSPYVRTQQTADIVSSMIAVPIETVDFLVPNSCIDKVIHGIPEGANTLIISHMPLVHSLTEALVELSIAFYTGSAVVIELPVIALGMGTLKTVFE